MNGLDLNKIKSKFVQRCKRELGDNLHAIFLSGSVASNLHTYPWSDIGGNIRSGGGKMYFIDWEFSSVSSSTELGYIKIHSHPTSKQFRQIVKLYAECSGISQGDILDGIKLGEKVTRVNDVIWAAMKCGQAETLKDIKKFKQLTYKRMEIYKKAGFK